MARQKIKNKQLASLELSIINKQIYDIKVSQEGLVPKKNHLKTDTYQDFILCEEE